MSEGGATAVSFTLMAWTLAGWVAFELWPELRAAKLRLRLRRIQMEQNSDDLLDLLEAAVRHAEEFRWLPMRLAAEQDPAGEAQARTAWEIVRHAAWGAPWMWLELRNDKGRERWMRRAWGLVQAARSEPPGTGRSARPA